MASPEHRIRYQLTEVHLCKPTPAIAGGAGVLNQQTAPGCKLTYDSDVDGVVVDYQGRKRVIPWCHVWLTELAVEAPKLPKA